MLYRYYVVYVMLICCYTIIYNILLYNTYLLVQLLVDVIMCSIIQLIGYVFYNHVATVRAYMGSFSVRPRARSRLPAVWPKRSSRWCALAQCVQRPAAFRIFTRRFQLTVAARIAIISIQPGARCKQDVHVVCVCIYTYIHINIHIMCIYIYIYM